MWRYNGGVKGNWREVEEGSTGKLWVTLHVLYIRFFFFFPYSLSLSLYSFVSSPRFLYSVCGGSPKLIFFSYHQS